MMSKGGRVFTILTVFFALVAMAFLIRWDKGTIHLAMDAWHTGTSPTFFKYWTHLGDGIAVVAAVVLLLALRRSGAMVISTAVTGITVLVVIGLLKNVVFEDVDRPWGYFEEGTLRLIPDLEQHSHKSFPSGHTTAAFALYAILAFWINKRWASIGLFLIALSVGYSRMYLNQHFLIDVFVGALLGTAIAWLNYYIFSSSRSPRLRSKLF